MASPTGAVRVCRVVAQAGGVRVVPHQNTGAVCDDLLQLGDGLIRSDPAFTHRCVRGSRAWSACRDDATQRTVVTVCDDLLVQGDGLIEAASISAPHLPKAVAYGERAEMVLT